MCKIYFQILMLYEVNKYVERRAYEPDRTTSIFFFLIRTTLFLYFFFRLLFPPPLLSFDLFSHDNNNKFNVSANGTFLAAPPAP